MVLIIAGITGTTKIGMTGTNASGISGIHGNGTSVSGFPELPVLDSPENQYSDTGICGINVRICRYCMTGTAGITPPEQRYSKLRNGGLIWTGILIYWKNCCQFVVHRIHCYRVLYFPILPLARINHRVCRQIIWRNRPGAAFCQRHIPIPYYAL